MCEQREQLLDYLYDETPPAGRRDIERHLEGCVECRDELRAFRNVREDLLAWGVPNPPSVWKAFAPVPVVPWHRQVPAWALAAAASLMFVLGGAGGFVANRVAQGQVAANPAALVPAALSQAPLLDSKGIMALIREELANANRDLTPRVTTVNNSAAQGPLLDAKAEARLMARVEEMLNATHMRQVTQLSTYLMRYAEEEVQMHDKADAETGKRFTQLGAEIDQLKALVAQLQTKGH
jgi:hypothetical protein